jgi:hypothetical protein
VMTSDDGALVHMDLYWRSACVHALCDVTASDMPFATLVSTNGTQLNVERCEYAGELARPSYKCVAQGTPPPPLWFDKKARKKRTVCFVWIYTVGLSSVGLIIFWQLLCICLKCVGTLLRSIAVDTYIISPPASGHWGVMWRGGCGGVIWGAAG